jgi:hypothetical protein
MKYIALFTLWGAMCFARQDPKPACNAKMQGQFWPAEANSDRQAIRRLYQSGELEMCSLEVWKYRWEHISVNARDVEKQRRAQASDSRLAASTAKGAEAGK